MENILSIYDYGEPVYRVLLKPDVFMGIGLIPIVMIFIITLILCVFISIWCSIVGLTLIFVTKKLCKNDPLMLTIIFDRLLQADLWRMN